MQNFSEKSWDWVSPVGALMGLVFLNSPNLMIFKKMRIMGTENIAAADCLGDSYYVLLALNILLLFLTFFFYKNICFKRTAAFLSGFLIAGLFYFSDNALFNVPLEKTEFSRMSIGIGMWLAVISYASVIIKAIENEKNKYLLYFLMSMPVLLIILLIITGRLNDIGIMMEYHTYQQKFHKALVQHILISLSVIITGIIIGIPLGYLTNQNKKWERIIITFINITETLPAISLITIIMIPLAIISNKYPFLQEIGISGFGIAAPFVSLVLYAIFPIIHNTQAAFKTIKHDYIEIAESMGMTNKQIFFKVKLPIALPVILAGIRIAVVYSIAGTTLAAFIGGGGLGTFILQNDSMDFVLLGTLPIISLTFVADSLLKISIGKLSNKRAVI